MQIQPGPGERKRVKPDPRVFEGRWVVDLRAAGFGQRYVLADATEDRETAIHLAYQLLDQLRGRRLAEAASERDLFGEITPTLFASALDAWERQKRYGSDGGAAWGKKYTRLVRRELGDYALADFAPPKGNARLAAYSDELRRRELSRVTIGNRMSIAGQVFRFAVERGWLPAAPVRPLDRLPPKPAPVFRWVTEAMFLQLRAAIFPRQWTPPDITDEMIARRRVYLSWLFYTGVHTHDADALTADDLFLDGRAYIRHNNKSARCVADEQFEMPEPLHLHLLELQALLGRPFFPAEKIGGGSWPHVARVLGATAKRLAFPHPVNPRILRRSYAREMFLRGYSVPEVRDRMGHVDDRMLKEIYVRTPRPAGHVKSRWGVSSASAPSPTGMARVLQIKGGAE